MNQIKCPHCGELFSVDESSYESIVSQIKNEVFKEELHEKLEQQGIQFEKDLKIQLAKSEFSVEKSINEKEIEILELKNKLSYSEKEKQFAVNNKEQDLKEKLNEKETMIQKLLHEMSLKDKDSQLVIQNSLAAKDKKLSELENQLILTKKEAQIESQKLNDYHQKELKIKEEEIQRYKDFKSKQNVKLLGETLELHCQNAFNQVRTMGFKNASFGKDNDSKDGTKGDYIFRDYDENGVEILSIMFEMKNEGDDSVNKQKNEKFFAKLDKDRHDKKCEYAVLVSILESDNDVYNTGIADVSYHYEKMYVIRPQFFIPLISLLKNAALNVLAYKQEVHIMRQQNVDVVEFEKQLDDFKSKIGTNFRLASEKFMKAVEEIDKSIKNLQNTRDYLISSEKNLRLANEKADDLSIKRLTKNSPLLKKKFEEIGND